MSNRRVVITGTGLITALGTGIEKNWQAMLAGRSGIVPITRFELGKLDTRFAGEVKDFQPEQFIDKREVRRMDLFAQYALAATEMAIQESGLPIGPDAPHGYAPEKVGSSSARASAACPRSRSSTAGAWRRGSTGCRPSSSSR